MRAVWSFWTLPYRLATPWPWRSSRHHLFSWILSVETARPHFAETALYTDDEGAALLVDGLGLHFTEVSTALNTLKEQDPDWWMLGKLHTYRRQREPFVHLDSDVYLWNPLPERLLTAPVLAQSAEDGCGLPWYDADACESVIRSRGNGWIPIEWCWYRATAKFQQAACCGIVGGNDLDFLQRYASTVIRILESPRNRSAFGRTADKKAYNPFFEQYLLCACAAFHRVRIEYLFDSSAAAFLPGRAAELGYTHLIAGAKSNPKIADRLELRIARDFFQHYERARCLFPTVS
jgi:hypothetical protein